MITEFGLPGQLILDPFCGSGTALVEAQRAGFDAVGIDLNPIACRISRVKTGPTLRWLGLVAARCRDAAARRAEMCLTIFQTSLTGFHRRFVDAASACRDSHSKEALPIA